MMLLFCINITLKNRSEELKHRYAESALLVAGYEVNSSLEQNVL